MANPLPARMTGTSELRIQADLVRYGFENVAVSADSSEVIIAYENRVFRFEARAMIEVLRIAFRGVAVPANTVLIPQNRAVPLVAVLLDSSACHRFMAANRSGSTNGITVRIDCEPYWHRLRNRPRANASKMKLDVLVHPQFKAQFGSPNDAVESQINLAPAASTMLWKGMSLSGQWIFPLQNEMEYEGDYARPGFLTLNQTVRLPSNTFVSGTAGYFTEHRYGVDLEAKTFWKNGRRAAGLRLGYTGFAAYLKNVWYYDDLVDWNACASFEVRFPSVDCVVKISGGRFLYGDEGFRFDTYRQVGESCVGFFAVYTNGGRNGGFQVSLPVFPARRMRPNRIRVSPALHFPWSYRYRGLPVYGIEYETGQKVDGFMKNCSPDFIVKQLGAWPAGR